MGLYSTSSDFAKDQWLDVFADQLTRQDGSLLNLFGLNTDERVKLEGRRHYMKIKTGDDLGFGMMTEGGDFPTPGDISSDEAELELHRFANTIKFTAHEMALLDSLSAAAAPIMAEKMSSARVRVLRELERQAIMDGTGILAKHASDSGATITLDVAGAEYAERNPYTWIDDANRSRYSLVNPTTGADVTQGWTISSIVESTNVITTSATQTTGTAADVIVTDYGASAWASGGAFRSLEFDGLLAMIDDGNTYLGINRSTAALAFWRSLVLDASGTNRSLTNALIHEFMNKFGRRTESGMVSDSVIGLASPGVWTSYHELMSSGIRYTASETPDIGWGGRQFLPVHGTKLYKHQKAPRNQMLFVNKDKVKFVGPKHSHSSIVKFLENNGSIFFQANAASGTGYSDSTYAMIEGWIGMYTERPREHARLDDITEIAAAY
jgi:hypothetical protein